MAETERTYESAINSHFAALLRHTRPQPLLSLLLAAAALLPPAEDPMPPVILLPQQRSSRTKRIILQQSRRKIRRRRLRTMAPQCDSVRLAIAAGFA